MQSRSMPASTELGKCVVNAIEAQQSRQRVES